MGAELESNEAALERFRKADWKRIQLELTLYAVYKVQRLHWRTSEGLPRGLLPQDLALGAIQKTLEGLMAPAEEKRGKGLRRWNPEKEPDLLEFLKSVVDSDVSSLVNLEEHALTNYCPDITPDDAAKLLQASIDENASSAGAPAAGAPEALLHARESVVEVGTIYERLMSELREACRKDPRGADELLVLDALEQLAHDSDDNEIRPAAIAKVCGLSEDKVRNAKRRIERRTRAIRERMLTAGKVVGIAEARKSERSVLR